MIPDFDDNGNIPPGIYCPSLYEFKDTFVTSFSESETRDELYQSYISYCTYLQTFNFANIQWVAGSYVSSKLNPSDVDTVIHLDSAMVDSIDIRFEILDILDPNEIKSIYHCHPQYVPQYPEGDPRHENSKRISEYWKKWFSRDRQNRPRGLIQFDLSSEEYHSALVAEVGS